MPANSKYLTTSPWQQFAKLSAGILGGYIIAMLLVVVSTLIFPFHKEILASSGFIIFILWIIFLLLPYLFKNGWMAWAVYSAIIIVLCSIYLITN